MRPGLVIALLVAAFWESWRWLVQRTWVTPDEAITLVVMILVVVGGVGLRLRSGGRLEPVPLLPLAAALVVYALTLGLVPSILSAAIAVTTTLAAIYVAGHHRRPPIAFWGLCCLVLPVVPTLQFYFGYPMRVVSAVLTVPLLRLNGVDVSLSGTALVWQGQHIQFDAPCSGVTMAWAGMLLVFTVATVHAYDWQGLARMVFLGLRLLLVANVLRAASLFYLEAGLLPGNSDLVHQAVGLMAFAAAMLLMLARMRRLTPCPA
ncbi:MAG: archaeosortase/exosortase family protein [Hyphomicrobiaceae bacterium]